MNIPNPCDTCVNLCVARVVKDDPDRQAECKLGIPIGFMNCDKYNRDKKEIIE